MRWLLLILSCFPAILFAQSFYGDIFSDLDLGKGYNPLTYEISDSCLHGNVKTHGRHTGKLNYFQRLNTLQIRRETFGSIKGGVDFFILAGSVSTSMYHSNATDNLSLSSQLYLYFDEGYSTLENRQWVNNSPNQNCGDQFIYQVNYGRDIFLNVKLHFRSEDDYKRFVTKIKIRFLFVKKTKTKVKEIEKYASNAVLTVDVNSNGPLPKALEEVMSDGNTVCSGNDIAPCLDTLSTITHYMFSDSGLLSDLSDLPRVSRGAEIRGYMESGHYINNRLLHQTEMLYDPIVTIIEERYGEKVREEQRAHAFYQIAMDQDEKQQAYEHWQLTVKALEVAAALRKACFTEPWQDYCRI